MAKAPNYECVSLYIDKKLMGITGLWFSTRHSLGKPVKPNHLIIDASERGQGFGSQFFK